MCRTRTGAAAAAPLIETPLWRSDRSSNRNHARDAMNPTPLPVIPSRIRAFPRVLGDPLREHMCGSVKRPRLTDHAQLAELDFAKRPTFCHGLKRKNDRPKLDDPARSPISTVWARERAMAALLAQPMRGTSAASIAGAPNSPHGKR